MIDQKFIILAVIIDLIGGADYVIDTLKGKTKPNRVTWFLWALIPAIALVGMADENASKSTMILTFMFGLVPLVVFIVSFFNKKSFWKISRGDVACGFMATLGIIAWIITSDGNLAIIFSMLANFFAWLPTAAKSFKSPDTENWRAFLCGALASFITLLTVETWTFASVGFPIYFTISCLITFSLIRYNAGLRFKNFIRTA